MKSLLYSAIAVLVWQAVLSDFVSHLKDEVKSAHPAMDAKAAEKELLAIPFHDSFPAKKDAKKDATVEAQLSDLLESVKKDQQEKEKKELENHELFELFKAYGSHDPAEDSDAASDKEALLSTMEDIIKKEVLASKKDVLSSDIEEDSSGSCKDVRSDCEKLARNGYCGSHEREMRQKCAKTCRYCVVCVNQIGDKTCKSYESYGYCKKHQQRMKKFCFKECGYCTKPPAVERECALSKFGCCWDKYETKLDKAGSNCPICKDQKKTLCQRFHYFCDKDNIAGKFMRKVCPDKCGVCAQKCADEFAYTAKCPTWKRLGWCKSLKPTMILLCQKTCDLC